MVSTPLKNDGVKVSWDDDIPNIWKNNPNVPNHQPVPSNHLNPMHLVRFTGGRVLLEAQGLGKAWWVFPLGQYKMGPVSDSQVAL